MKDRVHAAVQGSGYPFELEVAERTVELIERHSLGRGLRVFRRPSTTFRDREDAADRELDVSIEANRMGTEECGGALYVGIECKDSRYPYLCFGSDVRRGDDQHILESDWNITPSRGNAFLFSSIVRRILKEENTAEVSGPKQWFHLVRGLKPVSKTKPDGELVPDNETSGRATRNLAAWTQEHRQTLEDPVAAAIATMALHGPAVFVHHTVLATRLPHFRVYREAGELKFEEAPYTPVYLARTYQGRPVNYVVHLASLDGLAQAVGRMLKSFEIARRFSGQAFRELASAKQAESEAKAAKRKSDRQVHARALGVAE